MERKLHSSGSPWEARAGYSRAVVQGDWCFVAGTTGPDPETGDFPTDVVLQARNALGHVERALDATGFSFADVVRVVYYVTEPGHMDALCPVFAEVFGDVRPAATYLEVAGLAAPEMTFEVEVTALKRS